MPDDSLNSFHRQLFVFVCYSSEDRSKNLEYFLEIRARLSDVKQDLGQMVVSP